MGTLPEIEAAIKQLPDSDIRQLGAWLEEYLEQMWDKQIENDLTSGKLDRLIAKAEADIADNRVRNIDEILNNCSLKKSSSSAWNKLQREFEYLKTYDIVTIGLWCVTL
ncbi:hypothetical protein [Plectonema radiosum]|uniref:hypothetical protein n=1 Tax=Plectonema radiosum TaxID=945768 RepID=UPI001D153776|nr:hypothetical protein [Plectonema radiosum]